MLFSKSEEIKVKIGEHMALVETCLRTCRDDLAILLEGCEREELYKLMQTLRKMESAADYKRHEIIRFLLEGGLLVDSRKSIMHLIEATDRVADISEDIIKEIYYQQLVIPPMLKQAILDMMDVTIKQYELLKEAKLNVVSKYKVKEMTKLLLSIETLESQVDDLHMAATLVLFDSDLDLAYKRQLREHLNLIVSLSDLIEDISDEIEIIMMARKV